MVRESVRKGCVVDSSGDLARPRQYEYEDKREDRDVRVGLNKIGECHAA